MKCLHCGAENPQQASFCMSCGTALGEISAHSDPRLQALRAATPQILGERQQKARRAGTGQRKPVTILFADIVGSTSIAEQLDPEEWKEVVQGAHKRVSAAIYRYEGTIAQLLGDGVLAFFGAPLTHEDDPERAVRAALDIQASMRDYQRELAWLVELFQMRMGVNTGEVVIGEVGSEQHEEYLAIGDAVNVAARLQSSAEPGSVLISAGCARLVAHAFELEDLGAIEVKGKSDAVAAYEVLGLLDEPHRVRGLAGEQTPYVGRDEEVAELKERVLALKEGHGGIVSILGEAGIGKTRLVEEVREQAGGENGSPQIRWLEGRALSYGGALSNWVITQLLLADLELSDGAPQLKIKVALRKRVEQLLGDKAGEIYPYLAHLLELELEQEEETLIQSLSSETLRHQTKIELGRYFEAVAKQEPTALILEDLQWADPTSLETIGEMLYLTEWAPLLLIFLAREEREHPSWSLLTRAEKDFAERYTSFQLKRLDPDCSQELAEQMIRSAALPEEVIDRINERAEGNPFYVEEVVKHLLEIGAIVEDDGVWVVTDKLEEIGIPETLQGVLLARIDRLEEDVRETLQLASVIGKSFLYKILAAVSEAESQLQRHLSDLQRIDLIREKARAPELEYIFKHALTQEASYNSLLKERRRDFHYMVGQALERLFPDRVDEFLGLLAHHFEHAGKLAVAFEYYLSAGDQARLSYAIDEAYSLYECALNISRKIEDQQKERAAWLKIGLVHQIDFEFDLAHQAYEAAFALEDSSALSNISLHKPVKRSIPSRTLRVPVGENWIQTLDPGKAWDEWLALMQIFSGLAKQDAEHNVIPHIARSWEILEGGLRYIFHLRNDCRWTDGSLVSAKDFEWAWKRNISLGSESPYSFLFDDIEGAKDLRLGEISDTDCVGIRALDDVTIEVNLHSPTAFFLYIVTLPITYPLKRDMVLEDGDSWWRPESIVSNGAFRLASIDNECIHLDRRSNYSSPGQGNLDKVEGVFIGDATPALFQNNVVMAFQQNKIDMMSVNLDDKIDDLSNCYLVPEPNLSVEYLMFNPSQAPFNSKPVRKALALCIDVDQFTHNYRVASASGGLIHPGIPGYSSEAKVNPDPEMAQALLEEAGYPKGVDFPDVELAWLRGTEDIAEQLSMLWSDTLGISVKCREVRNPRDAASRFHIILEGWIPDYPDPDSILRQSSIVNILQQTGYSNEILIDLLRRAAICGDRSERLEIFREVDRLLVCDEFICIPFYYGKQSYWIVRNNISIPNSTPSYFEDLVVEE